MSATITLARQGSSDIIQHITRVDKSQGLFYTCVGCGKEMIVVKSDARKRDWHFRHIIEENCTGGRDTALHEYAVQVLIESEAIRITKGLHISYTNPRKEVTVFGKRSDVTVTHENEDVHFEVFVTHDLDKGKIDIYKINKIKCVRIDLSNPDLLMTSPERIKELLLNQHANKSIIYWPELQKKTGSDWGNILAWILGSIGIAFLLRLLFKRRKR